MKIITSPSSNQVSHPDENFEKGHQFENFIVTLFNQRNFRLMEWRSDKIASNGVFPLSNTYPDLEFISKGRRQHRFAIECKYRSYFYQGSITWADRNKISKYEQYQNQNRIQVFIAIGVGGNPANPDKLFITPLDHIKMYTDVYESHLIPYKKDPKQNVDTSEQLQFF